MKETEVTNLLRDLGDNIQNVAGVGWETLIQQQLIYGAFLVLLGVVSVIITIITWKLATNKKKEGRDRAVSAIVAAMFIVVSIGCFTVGGMKLLNPEYYAMLELKNIIGK
ncbi:hypothetical protein [Mammaliicoccus sp. P-M59]|uniref:hypothetical protein n=1 Tax=Mammaliicoccus sp. P-M59 TaxID=2898718 RepID=UPI001EFB0297|nr:hypothetical protein [Mammaliicoccus sp. P-M59]